ncbi:MAG: NADH-quinone oxidoreductase subunit L [Candidatus Edwardsbacteria bacterium]|nr:NADH-quinone oxidoreductase subunit L [Candidatus Edwardsbacteria bacterium]
MGWEFAVWATVLVPLLGCFTLPLAGLVSKPLRNAWAVILGAATVGFACSLIPAAFSGETRVFNAAIGLGVEATLVVDGLSVFMAIVSSLVSTLIIVYSLGYIKDYQYQQEYFLMVALFLGGMMGLVFSANLILMYVFWEITGICSWRLIGFFRDREIVVKADKAFLVTFGGAVFMLLGFAMVYAQSGTFNLLEMRGLPISGLAVALIAAGIFAKSATLPFHTWLPDAGVAPTPVTALLHAAVLVKIGVYAFARIFNYAFNLSGDAQTWLMVFGLVSAMVAACAALWDTNIKRILAYSTISQIGYIFMGLAAFNTVGIAGAILFILMHGLAKGGLFLAAGVIEHGAGTKDITRMGGLIKYMPVTAVAFLLCIFSIIGIPPFGGFFSKFMVIKGIVQSGNIAVASLAIFTALLTAVYLMRLFTMIFLGEARDGSIHAHREGTPSMVWVVASLAILSLAAGILVKYPMDLANIAVRDILGNPPWRAVRDIMGALR